MKKVKNYLLSLASIVLVVFTFIKLFGFGNIQFFNTETGEPTDRVWSEISQPVAWALNDQGSSNITDGSDSTAIQIAFDTWENIPTSSITFNFAGETGETDVGIDGANLITFADSATVANSNDPFLAFTVVASFSSDTVVDEPGADFDGDGDIDFPPGVYPAGTLFSADISFSDEFTWRTNGSFPDIQAIALHELGHFHGLTHSAILDASMYAVSGFVSELESRTLEPDDIIGSSFYYPDGNFFSDFGSITGKVLDGASGLGLPGAHVFAMDASGDTTVGFFSRVDGSYDLPGLPSGSYFVGIEPLDGDPIGTAPQNFNTVIIATAETDFQAEFWDANESKNEFFFGDVNSARTAIDVTAGNETQNIDVTTQAFPGRVEIEQFGTGKFIRE